MSSLICANCGSTTNTTVCDWISRRLDDGKADRCFLKWENDGWAKGCAYDDANRFEKHTADSILSKPTLHNKKPKGKN